MRHTPAAGPVACRSVAAKVRASWAEATLSAALPVRASTTAAAVIAFAAVPNELPASMIKPSPAGPRMLDAHDRRTSPARDIRLAGRPWWGKPEGTREAQVSRLAARSSTPSPSRMRSRPNSHAWSICSRRPATEPSAEARAGKRSPCISNSSDRTVLSSPSWLHSGRRGACLLADAAGMSDEQHGCVEPFRPGQRRAFQCGDGALHPGEFRRADRTRSHRAVQHPGTSAEDDEQLAGPCGQLGPPVAPRHGLFRVGPDCGVHHQRHQLVLARHVPVERHLGDTQACGDPLHGHSRQAFGVCDFDAGAGDVVGAQSRFGPRARPRGLPHRRRAVSAWTLPPRPDPLMCSPAFRVDKTMSMVHSK